MTEVWFDPNMYAWIPGTLLGVIGGGVGGPLIGVCAQAGKCRKLVFGFVYAIILISVALLVAGVVALVQGQPYGVWYGLGFPGLLGAVMFACFIPLIKKRFTQAELRKSIASDM